MVEVTLISPDFGRFCSAWHARKRTMLHSRVIRPPLRKSCHLQWHNIIRTCTSVVGHPTSECKIMRISIIDAAHTDAAMCIILVHNTFVALASFGDTSEAAALAHTTTCPDMLRPTSVWHPHGI